ncbi:hypothetical protein SAMN04488057_12055 [Cyclobacterium lianum]|uniref:Uncharacterized protein n=2 Tax=Cyclobacterium lianum TaxID=388280 RepID=A0A1M7QN30_9BACT|nr:hypothetical protein SAMN04488057_12055 [Cyclobacterium lianum]
MLGNSPVNGTDPDGAWFWEKSNVRQARQFARKTGGDFEKWKGDDGKRYAGVTVNHADQGSGTGLELDRQNVNFFTFRPGEDRSKLLQKAGVGFYATQTATSSGLDQAEWIMKSGNAWFEGTAEYDRDGQIPGIYKGLVGLNPLIAVPNALKILGENAANHLGITDNPARDIYGEEATSAIDIGAALFAVPSPIGPGAKISSQLFGKESIGEVADWANTIFQFSNDAGALGRFKEDNERD